MPRILSRDEVRARLPDTSTNSNVIGFPLGGGTAVSPGRDPHPAGCLAAPSPHRVSHSPESGPPDGGPLDRGFSQRGAAPLSGEAVRPAAPRVPWTPVLLASERAKLACIATGFGFGLLMAAAGALYLTPPGFELAIACGALLGGAVTALAVAVCFGIEAVCQRCERGHS